MNEFNKPFRLWANVEKIFFFLEKKKKKNEQKNRSMALIYVLSIQLLTAFKFTLPQTIQIQRIDKTFCLQQTKNNNQFYFNCYCIVFVWRGKIKLLKRKAERERDVESLLLNYFSWHCVVQTKRIFIFFFSFFLFLCSHNTYCRCFDIRKYGRNQSELISILSIAYEQNFGIPF